VKPLRKLIPLPAPSSRSGRTLEQALRARRSRRQFGPGSLSLNDVGQLLWAALGVIDATGRRTIPSAGGLHPLEARLAVLRVGELAQGLYRYDPLGHALSLCSAGDLGARLRSAAQWQDVVLRAAALIALSAVPARARAKYGERAPRYLWMEAGHAGQNIYLQAATLGLGVVALGAFHDAALAKVLELGADEIPLYLLAVGPR
jgi:SagB-type dehydrogenase family enzyme